MHSIHPCLNMDASHFESLKVSLPAFHNRASKLFPPTVHSKPPAYQDVSSQSKQKCTNKKQLRIQSTKAKITESANKNKFAFKQRPFSASDAYSRKYPVAKRRDNVYGLKETLDSNFKSSSTCNIYNSSDEKQIEGIHMDKFNCSVVNASSQISLESDSGISSASVISVQNTEDSKLKTQLAVVPFGGAPVPVVDIGLSAPPPDYDYQSPMKTKYNSVKITPFTTTLDPTLFGTNLRKDTEENNISDKNVKKGENLEPIVYGIDNHRQVSGDSLIDEQPQFPYKLQKEDDVKMLECNPQQLRPLPVSLEPLRKWLCDGVSQELTGVPTQMCISFLPSLVGVDPEDIPEVPLPHCHANEDLPYIQKLSSAVTPEPKRYHHPAWEKKPVEKWVCKHSKPSGTDCSQYKYKRYQQAAVIVRKEIEELENLMSGIRTEDSSCALVMYQNEIDHFKQMYEQAMSMVPERLLHPPEVVDTFGLKQFCQEHDALMEHIHYHHHICVQELAEIEAEIGIHSDRKYFKHVKNNEYSANAKDHEMI